MDHLDQVDHLEHQEVYEHQEHQVLVTTALIVEDGSSQQLLQHGQILTQHSLEPITLRLVL